MNPSSHNIVIRHACAEDNLTKTAEITYLADPYVYPPLFNYDYPTAIRGLEFLLRNSGVFSYRNCLLAFADGNLAGVLLYIKNGTEWDPAEGLQMLDYLGLPKTPAYEATEKQYLQEIVKFPTQYYLLNVAVLPDYRGCGICGKLLCELDKLADKGGCTLEVVSENTTALKVYLSHGYRYVESYHTFCLYNNKLTSYHLRKD